MPAMSQGTQPLILSQAFCNLELFLGTSEQLPRAVPSAVLNSMLLPDQEVTCPKCRLFVVPMTFAITTSLQNT